MRWLVLFLFIFTAVAQEHFFFDHLYYRWLGATHFELINPNLDLSEGLKKPAGTWQTIGAVHVLNSNFHPHKECLFYYVPFDQKPGILRLRNISIGDSCEKYVMEDSSMSLDDIYNFGLEIKTEPSAKYHLRIKVDQNHYDFRFPNFTKGERLRKKLSSQEPISALRGVRVGVPVNVQQSNKEKFGDGTLCFDVDNECKVKVAYSCDYCANSSFPVIASGCTSKFRQRCGANRCGQQGEPACIRGWRATGYDLEYCINDSPIGFCAKGLRVICFNGELVCR